MGLYEYKPRNEQVCDKVATHEAFSSIAESFAENNRKHRCFGLGRKDSIFSKDITERRIPLCPPSLKMSWFSEYLFLLRSRNCHP